MREQSKVSEKLVEMQDKYEALVRYARKSEEQIKTIPKAREYASEIQNSYPFECQQLHEYGDWAHGFNSGMLACDRYFLDIEQDGVEFANENFPSLDT